MKCCYLHASSESTACIFGKIVISRDSKMIIIDKAGLHRNEQAWCPLNSNFDLKFYGLNSSSLQYKLKVKTNVFVNGVDLVKIAYRLRAKSGIMFQESIHFVRGNA
jgi:hypothetical protein